MNCPTEFKVENSKSLKPYKYGPHGKNCACPFTKKRVVGLGCPNPASELKIEEGEKIGIGT